MKLSFSVPDKLKKKFESLKRDGETHASLLQRLIDSAVSKSQFPKELALTQEELNEVQEAAKKSGLPVLEIARQGLLARARALKTCAEKLTTIDLKDKSQTNRFFGVAQARIHQKVQELKKQDTQPINQTVLTKETRANLKAIKTYLQQHKAEINTYNQRFSKGL